MKKIPINIEITEPEAAVAMGMAKQGEPQAQSLGSKIVRAYITTAPAPKSLKAQTKKVKG